jgi:hypothetical protein
MVTEYLPGQLELFPLEQGVDAMAKEMSRSEKPEFFAKGGTTKMFEKGTAHEAQSGVSGKAANGGADGVVADRIGPEKEAYTEGVRMADGGGSSEMFGKGHAGKKVPGISGKATQEG